MMIKRGIPMAILPPGIPLFYWLHPNSLSTCNCLNNKHYIQDNDDSGHDPG